MAAGAVQRFYDEDPQREWDRLTMDRIEYAVTMRALDEHLPKAPATILDIGGGPGRYSIELAGRGYDVTLADLSQANLAFARERAAEAAVTLTAFKHADARDLSQFADNSFDAVLLMGPLYHLLDEGDRQAAVAEALRVVRPGGVLFAVFLTRYCVLRWWSKHNPQQVLENRPSFELMLSEGHGRDLPGFTDAYLEHAAGVVPFMEAAGARTVSLVGCEGVMSMIRDRVQALSGEEWEYFVDLNYRLSTDPSTHGTAEHLLYVGTKS